MRNARKAVWGAVFMALAAGCGRTPTIVPVEGVVRIDGQPLRKAAVHFISKDDYGPEYTASGTTDESGRYRLTCKGKPGACAGANQVLVVETPPPPLPKDANGHPATGPYYQSLGGRPIPRIYGNAIESPLNADVQAGRIEYDFDLTR